MKLHTGIILTLFFLAVVSCRSPGPASFWSGYRKDLLVHSLSDQGPYGGYRAMFWKTDKPNTFTSCGAIDFALKKGWKLVDSIFISSDTLSEWTKYDNSFPFSYTDFKDRSFSSEIQLPVWINSDLWLYRFSTGWIAVEPGNASQTEKNGYVVISKDGRKLSVYHVWGE